MIRRWDYCLWSQPWTGKVGHLGIMSGMPPSPRGNWTVKRKTAHSRLSRAITRIGDWLRTHCHWSVGEHHQILGQKLRGHYAYYGITHRRWYSAVAPAVRD